MAKPSEVVKITLESVDDGKATISVRLRGETRWMYFDNIPLVVDQTVIIHDGCEISNVPEIIEYSEVPLEFTDFAD